MLGTLHCQPHTGIGDIEEMDPVEQGYIYLSTKLFNPSAFMEDAMLNAPREVIKATWNCISLPHTSMAISM